jgi:receptor-type tyrosine-protein phosphatase R
VFIAADMAMQQFDQEGEMDLLQILSSLRQDRGGMIQTKEQYAFLHKVNTLGPQENWFQTL